MKKFFKKIVNKVKEVFHMAINAVNEAEIVKAEIVGNVIIHTEDLVADGVKGAVNLGKDVVNAVAGAVIAAAKAVNDNPLGYAALFTCSSVGASVGIGLGVYLKNKLA